MSKTTNALIAILIVGMFPAIVVYQHYNVGDSPIVEIPPVDIPSGDTEADEAKAIALDFLINAPTYSFDGINGSMEVVERMIAESYPVQYFITIRFDCSQAGYGDRSGMMLAQVITTHEARVTVVDGEIINAILDDQWDEKIQHDVAVMRIPTTETVVISAIEYIKENYPEMADTEVPTEWTVSNMNPEELLGAMKMGFSGGGWDITVSWAVVMEPVYSVTVSFEENNWSLSVDQNLVVVEITE
jgi:hypothetical protein